MPVVGTNMEQAESYNHEGLTEETSDSFGWQASEYVYHQKKPGWYLLFFVGVVGLVGATALTRQWFSMAVFLAMALALTVYATKRPRILNYRLDHTGVVVEGKHYPYHDFRSFAVIQDVGWHAIDLEPTRRFMPRLSILFDSDDFEKIMEILSRQLPQEFREPDWVERLTRYLKF